MNARSRSDSTAASLCLFATSILFSLLFIHWVNSPVGKFGGHLGVSCLAAFAVAAIHLVWRPLSGYFVSWIGLDTLFIPGFLICHITIPFMLWSGEISPVKVRWSGGSYQFLSQGAACTAFALAGFCLSFQIFCGVFAKKIKSISPSNDRQREYGVLLKTGNVLAFSGLVIFIFFLAKSGGTFLTGSYSGMHKIKEASSVMLTVSQMLLMAGSTTVVVFCHLKYRKLVFAAFPALAALGLVVIALIIHGDRGGIVQLTTPIVCAVVLRRKISLTVLFVALIVLLATMQIVFTARNASNRGFQSLSSEMNKTSFRERIHLSLINFGKSGLLVGVSCSYVDRKDHFYGRFTVVGLTAAVPYSRRLIVSKLYRSGRYDMQSSMVLTWEYLGHRNYGTGSTTVAEAYLDFGIFGVFYTHIMLGLVAAFLSIRHLKKPDEASALITYLIAMGIFAIVARYGAFTLIFRSLGFPVMSFYIVRRILSSDGKKKE